MTVTAVYRRAGAADPVRAPKKYTEKIAATAWLKNAMRADPAAELGAVTEHLRRGPRVTVFAKADILKG